MILGVDWQGITGLVAAIGSILTAVLAYLAQSKAAQAHTAVRDVRANLETGNGHTVGENSTAIASQVIPGRAEEDHAHSVTPIVPPAGTAA